jgi:hypothetical protein
VSFSLSVKNNIKKEFLFYGSFDYSACYTCYITELDLFGTTDAFCAFKTSRQGNTKQEVDDVAD